MDSHTIRVCRHVGLVTIQFRESEVQIQPWYPLRAGPLQLLFTGLTSSRQCSKWLTHTNAFLFSNNPTEQALLSTPFYR